MAIEIPRSKVDAIYDLRDAVEIKARAEHDVERDASPAARDALLAAALEVEAKTQDAIEACHECGHEHSAGFEHAHHARVSGRDKNVLLVEFRPAAATATDQARADQAPADHAPARTPESGA